MEGSKHQKFMDTFESWGTSYFLLLFFVGYSPVDITVYLGSFIDGNKIIFRIHYTYAPAD